MIATSVIVLTECSQIRAVSDNANILPVENIQCSSMSLTLDADSISTGWCGTDSSPYFIANFTEPVHLLYALASGFSFYYLTGFSYTYEDQLWMMKWYGCHSANCVCTFAFL